jgi:hypothetical protein
MPETVPGQQVLETPRVAGLAGVVFALLLAAAIVLLRLTIPEGVESVTPAGFADSSQRAAVQTALSFVPLAGICFLWFVGALRAQLGRAEDQFFASVLLGSGLVFVATLFGAAAAAAAVLATANTSGSNPGLSTWDFGRHFAYTLMTGYAMRMAAVFTCSTTVIGLRLKLMPRWLGLLGLLTALTLLFVSTRVPWSELVFPAWSLIVGAHMVIVSGGSRPGAAVS